jgi:hypothetical protein
MIGILGDYHLYAAKDGEPAGNFAADAEKCHFTYEVRACALVKRRGRVSTSF